MRLLDVAAGGGALSIPAARLGLSVLATAFSPAMVERLQQNVREQGLPNLQVKVMDGTALELGDKSFDMVCSQLGIMLFQDRLKGLREMARVTKPGGKGVVIVFGPLQQVQFFSLFFQSLSTAMPGFTPPKDLPLFSYQNPETLKRDMEKSGFKDVQVKTVHHVLEVASADQLWAMLGSAAPPVAKLLSQFSSEQQAAAQKKLGELVREKFEDGPIKLSGAFHVAVGTK
jgi:ubiquinone/menaquinone biosynthesis C-methylase UbiE